MFKTKKDVDRHVRTALSKLRSENEKNLRGFTIAKLYFKINEYATAQHYISLYLSVKEDCAPAHKLLGHCYQHLKKPDKALASFQRSLQLDSKQSDLLIEVCKLFLTDETLNPNKAKYWCDLAESEKVQNDVVFSLRLKLLNKDNFETKQVEEMIMKEIVARPNDPNLRVRLVRHFIEENKILDAFKYAYDLEMKNHDVFSNCAEWYNTVWMTLTKYKQLPHTKKSWEFWVLLIICLERQIYISFFADNNNVTSNTGTIETANLLFTLDQYLFEASQCMETFSADRELYVQFLNHYKGQLCLHASSLIFKREKTQNKNQWRETTKNAVPLLLLAYHCGSSDSQGLWSKHTGEQTKQLLQLWSRESAFRCAQAGRTLLSCAEDSEDISLSSQVHQLLTDRSGWNNIDDLLVQTRKFCSDNNWRSKIFRILFPNSDQIIKMQTSLLVNCQQFTEPNYELPSVADIETYEEIAQYLKPQSLAHMVYLCLSVTNLNDIRCKYFNGLNFSTQNLSFCGAESLNQLDIETFLYAATIQAKRSLEIEKFQYENYNSKFVGRPLILPFVNLSSHLCSEEQINWWLSAYQVYKNLATENLGELRATLQYGIEAVRAINGPKIDLIIVLKLGNIFLNRAQDVIKPIEKAFLEARAENLFKYGLNMLKLHMKGVLEPFRKFFKYANANTSSVEREIGTLSEEAITYLAGRHFKNAEYEECIEELSGIQLPFATYFQAESYRKLDESNKTPKKNKKIYLEKAKECLNQTQNLLSLPSVDTNHPLKSVVLSEIKCLEYTNQFGADRFSNGCQADDYLNETSNYNKSRSIRDTVISPPRSVELENLIKQMNTTLCILKDEIICNMKPEVSEIKNDILDLKQKLATIEENIKKKSGPPSRDETNFLEDLYITDDELQNQLYANQQPIYSGYNQPHQQRMTTTNAIVGQQITHHPHPVLPHPQQPVPPANAYNNHLYNTTYPMNYYPQFVMPGAPPQTGPLPVPQRPPLGLNPHVPFVDHTINYNMQTPQQAPIQIPQQTIPSDNRNLFGLLSQPPISTSSLAGLEKTLNQSMSAVPNVWNRLYNNAPVEKDPPANVVITSSDPLPAHTNVCSQSTLSVTIPPHHRKSNLITSESINIQNSMQQSSANINLPIMSQNISFTGGNTSGMPLVTSSVYNTPTSLSVEPQIKGTDSQIIKSNEITPANNIIATSDNNLDKSQDSTYDPHYEPIIPLPDEVEVVTGEENEEILFCSRAKLLRLVNKEWKERGLGDIKILKNKLDGKVRILMRREQTHKICANHVITPEMILIQGKVDEKSYIWVANDFADEVLTVEKLCVRFKLIETAKEFYNVFVKAQKETGKTEVDSTKINTPISKSPTFNFGRTSTPTVSKLDTNASSSPFMPSNKTIFSIPNSQQGSLNNTTKSNAPAEVKISPFAEFSFDRSKTDSNTPSKPFANIFANLTTGDGVKPIALTAPQQQMVGKKDEVLNKSAETPDEDDYVPTAQFKPVIPLPDLVEVQTGEENETVLFEHRAKLLRFDKQTNEWKERGIGNIKLLVDNNDVNRVRLVMRREIVFKLCCNQRLTKKITFTHPARTQSALTWCGQDFSENELHTEVLTIRFKTAEICKSFHDAILKAQENMTDDESSSSKDIPVTTEKETNSKSEKGFGDKFKPKAGCWDCGACYVSNKADVQKCIACNTPKVGNIEKIDEQKNSLNLFTHKKPEIQGFGDKFKPQIGEWSCQSCYTSNTKDTIYCVACEAPKDNTVPKKPSKNIFESIPSGADTPKKTFNFGFTSNTSNPILAGSTSEVKSSQGFGDKFKPKTGSWSCEACYTLNDATLNYCVACDSPKDDTVPKKPPANIFGTTNTTTSTFSFGFPATIQKVQPSSIPIASSNPMDLSKPTPTTTFAFGTPSTASVGFKFGTNSSEKSILESAKSNIFSSDSSENENSTQFVPSTTTTSTFSPFNFTPSTLFGVSVPLQTDTKTTDSNISKPSFSFNLPKNPATENIDTGFKLEKQEFNFVLKPKSPGKVKSPLKNTSGCDDESDTENVEEENSTYFTPVISLPDKIDVKTGEEFEEILYCHRAKLYRFTDSEWKERGLGDLKILRHKESKKLRVVMRREQILKICLNHALTDDIEYSRKDDKSWHFVVNDYSEGEIELMQFCLRFKNKEIAEEFMQSIKLALCGEGDPISIEQVENKSISEEIQTKEIENISEKEKKLADDLKLPYSFFDETTISKCTGCRGCDSDNFVFPEYKEINKDINEDKPLPLEMTKLSLSRENNSIIKQSSFSFVDTLEKSDPIETKSFFGNMNLFGNPNTNNTENKLNTSQFQGSETKFVFSNIKPTDKDDNKFGSTNFVFGNPNKPITFGNADNVKPAFGQNFIFGGASNKLSTSGTEGQKSVFGGLDLKPKEGGNIFGSSNFTFGTSLTSTNINGGNIFGNVKTEKNTENIPPPEVENLFKDPGISFSTLASPNNKQNTENIDTSVTAGPMFKNDPGISFATLAQNNATVPFSTTTTTKTQNTIGGFVGLEGNDAFKSFLNPKQSGQNQNLNTSNLSQNDNDTSGNDGKEYDPHYEAIIPLPAEIVVSTGEEEEEKIFGERATLYRYDTTTKEWKERGVGELKILHHPVQKTYRLILRREQIHKLVLNHAITVGFFMNLMNTSGKAFCWATMNYAEESPVYEKLAARFKTVELAARFENEVKKCVEQLQKRADLAEED